MLILLVLLFSFKQKAAYDMRIGDWISDCALPIFLLPESQGVLDAACQSFRRVSLEGAGALCEGVGRQEANALDLFRDTIRIGLQDRLEIRNGRDDLFSDFGADAQFGEHGMRSVFGHLLAPRGDRKSTRLNSSH